MATVDISNIVLFDIQDKSPIQTTDVQGQPEPCLEEFGNGQTRPATFEGFTEGRLVVSEENLDTTDSAKRGVGSATECRNLAPPTAVLRRSMSPTELVVKEAGSPPCQNASSLLSLEQAKIAEDFEKCICECDHEFIIDWIDIDPDKSQQIVYCKFCYLEG